MKVLGIVVTVMAGLLIGAVLYRALGQETVADIDSLAAFIAPYMPILGGAFLIGVFLWTAGVIEQRLTQIRDALGRPRARADLPRAASNDADPPGDTFLFDRR